MNRPATSGAVELFRSRSATRQDKGSAVRQLHSLLEEHRKLLKNELLSKDEGALFNIANNSDIRQQRQAASGLRRGVPRLDLLVVPGHPRPDRSAERP